MTDVAGLTSEAESIHARYRRAFVGRTRATRDLSVLDAIIRDMHGVSPRVPTDAHELRSAVDGWLTLYQAERQRIAKIQAQGPDAIRAWRLVEWIDLNQARYEREFGGKWPSTCDDALLGEMADRQSRWLAELDPLATRIGDEPLQGVAQRARRNLARYRAEVDRIRAARVGQEPAVLSQTLATLANAQFGLYRRNILGRPRPSRRPALLRRLITALEGIEERMRVQRDLGQSVEGNTRNLDVVGKHLATYRSDLKAVVAARAALSPDAIARVLGEDANSVFAEYRKEISGRPPQGVDLARLGELCDRLHEVLACMEDTQIERPSERNADHIVRTRETLKSYEKQARAFEQDLGRA